MTDRKSDVDVSELLHQLEELKKKKAQNVKKLKRKLGRAVLLSKPECVAVSTNYESNNLEKKTFLKVQTPETRNILSELNCETSNLNTVNLAEGKQENFFEKNEKVNCLGTEDYSRLLPNNLNQELDSKSVSQSTSENVSKKGILTETEATSNLDAEAVDVSKSSNNAENYFQEEEFRCSGKRSSSDAEKEDLLDSQSSLKRLKLSNGESTLKNKNKSENDSNLDPCLVNIDKGVDSEVGRQIVPNSIQSINQETEVRSQKISSKINFNDFKIQENAIPFTEVNNQSHFSLITEDVTAAKNLSSDFQSLETINSLNADYISSINLPSVATLNKEKRAVMDLSQLVIDVPKSSSSLCNLKGTVNIEIEIDPNVTEIADTEIDFDKKSEINATAIKESLLDHNSEISDRKDTFELPLKYSDFKEECVTSCAFQNEDICLVNIQSNVASFEEIRTEIPQTEVVESTLHVEDNKDSIHCDFTDEESEYSKCFDSNELEALCQNDDEEDFESSGEGSQLNSTLNEEDSCSIISSKLSVKDNQEDQLVNVPDSECLVVHSDVLVVPETELFDFASYNETEVDDIGHNVSIIDTDNNEDKRKNQVIKRDNLVSDSYSLSSEIISHSEKCTTDQFGDDTDSLGTEDFLKLVNYQLIPRESDLPEKILSGEQSGCLNFQCCLRSDISEAVTRLKLTHFNNSQYMFIQHITWIQVWRQEKDHDWMKIFAHQVESFKLQDLCLSQSENYLVLVMLLNSEENSYCLNFLVFERESKLIKLMEHTHWFENKCEKEENIFLCGLDGLKFASAQGSHTFKVYSHTFSCLDGDPRLFTVALGSSNDCLHSLCRIDKLPNALLGMSNNMLYVWHLLEARLVTSVFLQVEDSFDIESCIWAILENGLIFLMVACKEKENSEACQLLAANLATGFCEVVLTYTLQPVLQVRLASNRKMITYLEPLIGMTCENGAYIWSVKEEYCCAYLNGLNYTSIAIISILSDSFLIIVGCNEGCVNCYELRL